MNAGGSGRAILSSPVSAAPPVADHFVKALERSHEADSKDEIQDLLNLTGRISLGGNQIRNLSRLRVGSDGTIYIIDVERRKAEAYDADGKFLRMIGGPGTSPGKYAWPSDLTCVAGDQIAISDFQGHRVNLFGRDGQFLNSFIYTPQKFSAQRMVYVKESRSYLLFGNRWVNDSAGNILGASLVHRYSESGEFMNSCLDFPEWAKPLDLYSSDSPVVDCAENAVYLALPFEYKVYRVTDQGAAETFLSSEEEKGFVRPATALNIQQQMDQDSTYRSAQNWMMTWTPVKSLVVVGDRMFIEYQTFDPLRYTIDVWSVRDRKKLKSVKTNHLIFAKGADSHLYLLENNENRGQNTYGIVRADVK